MRKWSLRFFYLALILLLILVVVNIFAINRNRNKIISAGGSAILFSPFFDCQRWIPLTNYESIFYFSTPFTEVGLLKNFVLAPDEIVLFSHLDDGTPRTSLHGESSLLFHINNKKILFTKDRMRLQVFKIKTLSGKGNAIGKIDWLLINKNRFNFEYGLLAKKSPVLTFRTDAFPDSFIYCKTTSRGKSSICKSNPENSSLENFFAMNKGKLIRSMDILCEDILPNLTQHWKPLPEIKRCDMDTFFDFRKQIPAYSKACSDYKLILRNNI